LKNLSQKPSSNMKNYNLEIVLMLMINVSKVLGKIKKTRKSKENNLPAKRAQNKQVGSVTKLMRKESIILN
jgi:hypothetical protein